MPPSSIERDRRRLAVAAVAAVALHALAIGALALIAIPRGSLPGDEGGFMAAGSSRSGGGQGTVSLFVSVDEGASPLVPQELPGAAYDPDRLPPAPRADSPPASEAEPASAVPGSDQRQGGAGSGTGTGFGPGTGDGDPTGTASGRFVTWLDGAIRAKLHYPERARARNAEGTVVVSLTVSPDGKTCEAVLAESSGDAALDRAALTLVRSLFPAKVAPETVFSAPVRIRFALTSDQ